MSQLPWYVARASGIVAWVLLSASVIWGLMLSTRTRPQGVRPAWVLDLHRFLGGLACLFVGVHLGALLLDSFTSFGPTDLLVPFASSWHPVAVAWGVTALYLLAAVELTSLARDRLPRRLWRATHVLAFPLWVLATVHFVAAGSEAGNPLVLAAIGVATAVIGLLTERSVRLHREAARRRAARPRSPQARIRRPVAVANAGADRRADP